MGAVRMRSALSARDLRTGCRLRACNGRFAWGRDGQVVLRPLVGVRGSGGDTLDISPSGRPHRHRRKPLIDLPPTVATLDTMRLL